MTFVNDKKNGYLLDTEVENIFISEHMVTAPGDYVKVYLEDQFLPAPEEGQTVYDYAYAVLNMLKLIF